MTFSLSHADINEDNFGLPYDHGTPFRRAVEEKLIAPGQSIQVGMRGSLYSRDHYKKSEKLGFKIIPMAEVRQIGIERTIKIESEYRNFVNNDLDSPDCALIFDESGFLKKVNMEDTIPLD
jgi:agmatinase